jgi:hypothetical protein
MVALGEQSESRYWNEFLSDLAGIGAGDLTGDRGEYINWDKFDTDHPVFSIYSRTTADNSEPEIPGIQLYYYRDLSGGNIIGSSSSGANVLAESVQRPVMVYSSGFDFQSGDLPAHSFFLPFLVRSIEYLGSRNADLGFSGIIGEPFRWNVESSGETYSLIAPDETIEKLKTTGSGTRAFISGAAYREPGIYTLREGDKTVSLPAFNVDPAESGVDKIETGQINELLGADIRGLSSRDDIGTSIKEARFGRELWKEFLVFALILLIIESLLGKTSPPKGAEN